MIRIVFFVCSALFLTHNAAAQWSVTKAPLSTHARWMAIAKNDAGHTLKLWRRIKGTKFHAICQIELANGLSFKTDTLPQFAIDNESFRAIELASDNTATVSGSKVSWTVWSATSPEFGPVDSLQTWRRGSKFHFQFVDQKGKKRVISFTLDGSKDAIDRVVTGTYK